MSRPSPSVDAWLKEAKAHESAPRIGMYLTHNGVVRQTAKVQARQMVVTEGPLRGTTLELASSPILLGRAQEATLVLEDDYASGRHARLFPQGSRWFIEDLGSTNGTFLGGSQLTRAQPVDPGVPIRIGKTVIELRP